MNDSPFYYWLIVPHGPVTPAPVVSSITPNAGALAGGTAISDLHGTGFVAGATVTIGGVAATAVVFVSSVKLTCVAPAHAAGAVNVVVTNPDTQTSGASGNGLYTYNAAPTVSAITPTAGALAGGTAISDLHGTGFITGATVTIGGVAATGVVFVSSVKLTCVTPAHAAGATNIVVTNPDTQNSGATGNGLYTYQAAPTVSAISPVAGALAGGTAAIIGGTGFITGATVTIGGVAATGVVFVSSIRINCVTPAHTAGATNVVVTNPDTQNSGATGNGLYTYQAAPTVSSITPNAGALAGGTAISDLHGTGFITGATVTIGGVAATAIVFVSSVKLTCVAPAHAAGATNVVVTNPDSQTSGASGNGLYTYNAAPTVSAITPNTGSTVGGDAITDLHGTGFITGATATIGGVAATSVVFVSSVKLTCVTPAHAAGATNVVVTNPDTQTSGASGNGLFTYNSPFDPTTLDLSGYWRASFSGSPWAAVASAGASLANGDLTEGTFPPTVGATVNGFDSAAFDGSLDLITNATDILTMVSDTAGSLVSLFKATSAFADPGSTSFYLEPPLVGSGTSRLQMGFSTAGISLGTYDGGGWDSVRVACGVGAWHLAQARWDATTIEVRVDGGAWQTLARTLVLAAGGSIYLGQNFSGVQFFDGLILESMSSQLRLSDADFDNIKSYVNTRYALTL